LDLKKESMAKIKYIKRRNKMKEDKEEKGE